MVAGPVAGAGAGQRGRPAAPVAVAVRWGRSLRPGGAGLRLRAAAGLGIRALPRRASAPPSSSKPRFGLARARARLRGGPKHTGRVSARARLAPACVHTQGRARLTLLIALPTRRTPCAAPPTKKTPTGHHPNNACQLSRPRLRADKACVRRQRRPARITQRSCSPAFSSADAACRPGPSSARAAAAATSPRAPPTTCAPARPRPSPRTARPVPLLRRRRPQAAGRGRPRDEAVVQRARTANAQVQRFFLDRQEPFVLGPRRRAGGGRPLATTGRTASTASTCTGRAACSSTSTARAARSIIAASSASRAGRRSAARRRFADPGATSPVRRCAVATGGLGGRACPSGRAASDRRGSPTDGARACRQLARRHLRMGRCRRPVRVRRAARRGARRGAPRALADNREELLRATSVRTEKQVRGTRPATGPNATARRGCPGDPRAGGKRKRVTLDDCRSMTN